jgi:HSP20 family protein
MAETKNTQPENTKQGGQALSRNDREQGTFQRRNNMSGGSLSDPFAFVDRMAEQMDRTFDQMFRDFGMPRRSWLGRPSFGSGEREGLWSPRVEAFQKGDRFIVRAELPGLKKDDVQVDLNDNALTIHGERREEHEDQREGYYRSERQYGQFSRTIPLPEGVIPESAEASFRDGVLEISMQAPPAEATRRRVEIKEASEGGPKK